MLPTSKILQIYLFLVPLLFAILTYILVKQNSIDIDDSRKDVVHSRYSNQLKFLPLAITSWNKNDNLQTVKKVFKHLGLQRVNRSEKDWNVLWTLEYPFEHFEDLMGNFTGGQIMNHIPGITYITNKKYLSTSSISKYIPAAFSLPHLKNEFMYYMASYPEKKYVVKNFDNRGVQIIDPRRIDFQLGEER